MNTPIPNEQMNSLFRERYENECARVNVLMTFLMMGQWILGILFAMCWSPFTWMGQSSYLHIHVSTSMLIGGSISGFAILWLRLFPRAVHSRHVVAVTQMLWSALLIHLSGGRIETHFHVFASLAILSLYRDWKVLITATVVVAVDHVLRGIYYPLSVFGIVTESPYRWIEHTAWLLFQVGFLVPGCRRLRDEIMELCIRQTEIEEAKRDVDLKVAKRTRALISANEALAEKTAEAENLALIARHTDHAIAIIDPKSKIEWINDGYSRITGYAADDVIGQPASATRVDPIRNRGIRKKLRRALANKQRFDSEFITCRKDGTPYWSSLEIRPIPDASGNMHKMFCVERDISIRKQMELTLAQAEERLRSIINNLPGACYRRQPDGKLIFVSAYFQTLIGIDGGEMLLRSNGSHLDFVISEDRHRVMDAVDQATRSGTGYNLEYRIEDLEGNTHWVSEIAMCSKADENNNTWVDGMLFDVTDRVLAQQENERLQQDLLEVSRQAGMAEIANGVLHNVGNILNSVNVSASVIQREFSTSTLANLEKLSSLLDQHNSNFANFVRDDSRGQKVPAYLGKVTEALRDEQTRITTEVDDLLKNIELIKEIIAVQQTMSTSDGLQQQLNIKAIFSDALAANKASLMNHVVNVQQRIDSAVPEFIADRNRVLQILINLIKNAKDATLAADAQSPRIELSASLEDDSILIQVTDNGIGIPEDKLNKVFQHGFTTKKHGHGFGLHSSANAATEMRGSLSVISAGLNQGATFELRLPLHQSNPLNQQPSQMVAP